MSDASDIPSEEEGLPATDPLPDVADVMSWCREQAHMDKFDVYPPSDDTFLMAECILSHWRPRFAAVAAVKAREGARVSILEVGSGSGALLAVASREALAAGCNVQSTAVDPYKNACNATELAVQRFAPKAELATVQRKFQDYASESAFDYVLFNPPYVPTPQDELDEARGIHLAWAGGPDGTVVVREFIRSAARRLTKGRLLLCGVEENEPEKLCTELLQGGFSRAAIILRRECGIERLWVIEAEVHESP